MFADVTSANIVGYVNVVKGNEKKPTVGGVFCPIGNGKTWKLNDIQVASTNTGAKAKAYMNCVTEYVQVLDENTAAVTARYTYMSLNMLKALYATGWEAYTSRVGWWYYTGDAAKALKTKIESPNYQDYMVPDTVTFPVGRGLLSYFTGTSGLVFETSGEVPQETTGYTAGNEKKPLIVNYIPRPVDLTEISVVSTNTGAKAKAYMNCVTEYIQKLDANSAAVTARYTYMSLNMLKALYATGWEAYTSRVGWWYYAGDAAKALKTKIESANYQDYMVAKDAAVFNPGEGFLCYFTGTSGLVFNFPSAIEQAE